MSPLRPAQKELHTFSNMESHAPALELGEGENMPGLALPPNIDKYVPLQAQQYGTSPNGQPNRDTSNATDIRNAQALPNHSRVCMVVCLYYLNQ